MVVRSLSVQVVYTLESVCIDGLVEAKFSLVEAQFSINRAYNQLSGTLDVSVGMS